MKLIKKLLKALRRAQKCYAGQPLSPKEDTRPIEEIPFEERLAQLRANRVARGDAPDYRPSVAVVRHQHTPCKNLPPEQPNKPNKPIFVRAHYRNRPQSK